MHTGGLKKNHGCTQINTDSSNAVDSDEEVLGRED
jgi:hypothetical protein